MDQPSDAPPPAPAGGGEPCRHPQLPMACSPCLPACSARCSEAAPASLPPARNSPCSPAPACTVAWRSQSQSSIGYSWSARPPCNARRLRLPPSLQDNNVVVKEVGQRRNLEAEPEKLYSHVDLIQVRVCGTAADCLVGGRRRGLGAPTQKGERGPGPARHRIPTAPAHQPARPLHLPPWLAAAGHCGFGGGRRGGGQPGLLSEGRGRAAEPGGCCKRCAAAGEETRDGWRVPAAPRSAAGLSPPLRPDGAGSLPLPPAPLLTGALPLPPCRR